MSDPSRATPATLATRRRALELGASFIEHDLAKLRYDVRALADGVRDYGDATPVGPVSTSHEADVMKAMEWASAIVWLRALAEQEPRP